MIGILAFEEARCIDEPELESEVPVGFDVLRVQNIDELLRTAANKIVQFGKGPGSIIKPRLLNVKCVCVKGMKAGIPSRRRGWVEQERSGSCSVISQPHIF